MRTHPHSTASMPALLMKLYRLGWYVGTHELCTITVEGGFEHNLSNRATEDWNLIFKVSTKEIKSDSGKVILKACEARAETLEDAVKKVVACLERE